MAKTSKSTEGSEPQERNRSMATAEESGRYVDRILGPIPSDIVDRVSQIHAAAVLAIDEGNDTNQSPAAPGVERRHGESNI